MMMTLTSELNYPAARAHKVVSPLISVLVARGGGTTPMPRSLIIVPTKTRPGCPTVAFASGSLAALVFSAAPSLMRTAPTSTWSPLLPIIRYYLFLLTTFVFVSFSVLSRSILHSANLSNLFMYAVTGINSIICVFCCLS